MTSALALPAPIRRRSPQDIASRAHRVLDAALADAGTWKSHRAAVMAAADLDKALDEFGALERGDIHWDVDYHHLRDEADPHGEALDKAAEEADALARALILAIAVACGTDVADVIKEVAAAGGAE